MWSLCEFMNLILYYFFLIRKEISFLIVLCEQFLLIRTFWNETSFNLENSRCKFVGEFTFILNLENPDKKTGLQLRNDSWSYILTFEAYSLHREIICLSLILFLAGTHTHIHTFIVTWNSSSFSLRHWIITLIFKI